MNNNIYLNQDPLLIHKTPDYQTYADMPMPNVTQLYNQFNREPPQTILKDWIGELDETVKNLDPSIVENLNQNKEFMEFTHIIASNGSGRTDELGKRETKQLPDNRR